MTTQAILLTDRRAGGVILVIGAGNNSLLTAVPLPSYAQLSADMGGTQITERHKKLLYIQISHIECVGLDEIAARLHDIAHEG
jgi:hypothetical protein